MKRMLWFLVGSVAWLCALLVRAEVTLPDGSSIPRNSNNGEVQLFTLFANRNEAIDWIADGFPAPNTFSPLCSFRATFLLKQSASSLAVGWYNVVPGATTAPTQIIPVVPAGTAVGTVIEAADIRSHAMYAGGLIGFALIKTPPHYSEAKWNTKCTSNACSTAGHANEPWILSVSYRSLNTPNAYYVAFEDGDTSASSFGNDGDYNDYVFLFEGLVCAGDGEPCEVPGALGECKPGITECNNSGGLECKGLMTARDEICDGLDNDCDGESDEGDSLCASDEVCSRGACVPLCGGGEFACSVEPLTLCENGICIDPRCQGVECPNGAVCVAGECRAPCDGVVCPNGRSCRAGVCVDPCAGVECSEGRVCVDGACVLDCSCSGCDTGLACDVGGGLCLFEACQGKSCEAGQYCAADGNCTDSCAGATCPGGTRCELGECVPVPPSADAGVGGDGDGDGNGNGNGNGQGDGGLGVDAGLGGTGGDAGDSEGAKRDSSGCSCRVARSRGTSGNDLGVWALLALGTAWVIRRRRA